MFTHTKRLIQLSLVTLFTTLLFLGMAGVSSAVLINSDNYNNVKVVIKEECHNGTDKPTRRTIKSAASFHYFPTSTNMAGKNGVNISPFPLWDSSVLRIYDFEINGNEEYFYSTHTTVGNAGIALTKNLKTGTFRTVMDSLQDANVGGRLIALSGKLKIDENGNGQKIVGKITGYDASNNCTYDGKFKGTA
jgi:hypothetical protein